MSNARSSRRRCGSAGLSARALTSRFSGLRSPTPVRGVVALPARGSTVRPSMADAIEQMRATTIVRLHGHIVGGGVVLASACDLRISAEDARFSIPEVELGIPLAWGGIPRLVREIGPAMTKELVMTCRTFTPQEAQAMRFVNRVVPFDELDQHVEQLAAQIIRMPSVPVVITKEHVNAVSRAMSAGLTSFADGEALLSAITDPESLQARNEYTSRRLKKADQSSSDKDSRKQ